MIINRKDVAAGGFFVGVGVLYGGIAWRWLPVGHALNMGPGYFPIVLSTLLTVLGATTLLRGFSNGSGSPFGIVPWRALVMLSLATVVFAAFIRQLGLLPAVFASSMLASMSSPQIKVSTAGLASLLIALFSTAVFIYGINLPIPIFGSWFRG